MNLCLLLCLLSVIKYIGGAVVSWVKHWTAVRKVVGSIPCSGWETPPVHPAVNGYLLDTELL